MRNEPGFTVIQHMENLKSKVFREWLAPTITHLPALFWSWMVTEWSMEQWSQVSSRRKAFLGFRRRISGFHVQKGSIMGALHGAFRATSRLLWMSWAGSLLHERVGVSNTVIWDHWAPWSTLVVVDRLLGVSFTLLLSNGGQSPVSQFPHCGRPGFYQEGRKARSHN